MLEDTNFPVTRKKGFLPIFVETAYPGLTSAIIKTRNEAWHVCTFPGLSAQSLLLFPPAHPAAFTQHSTKVCQFVIHDSVILLKITNLAAERLF